MKTDSQKSMPGVDPGLLLARQVEELYDAAPTAVAFSFVGSIIALAGFVFLAYTHSRGNGGRLGQRRRRMHGWCFRQRRGLWGRCGDSRECGCSR